MIVLLLVGRDCDPTVERPPAALSRGGRRNTKGLQFRLRQHSQRHNEDDEGVGGVLRLRGLSRCLGRLALNIAGHQIPTFKSDADKARAPDEVINPAPSWNGRFCLGGPERIACSCHIHTRGTGRFLRWLNNRCRPHRGTARFCRQSLGPVPPLGH